MLAIKDMAGLLKPPAARMLVRALRRAYPELPIHVHTHDTAGTGVASMIACAEEDADVVDAALPAMAGLTSQPTMAGIVAALANTDNELDIGPDAILALNAYWELGRGLYAPFESGLTGYAPDLYMHEIPGGQYTNLRFQAQQLGLLDRWESIKRSYAAANRLLGDVIKVTPTSKVVGDLAQFMVQNDLDEAQVVERAETLSFPQSVVDFMAGMLGEPHGGYPEPLRTRVLKGQTPIAGRPGASLEPFDFEARAAELRAKHPGEIRDVDVLSSALYPKVFDDYRDFRERYSDVSMIPTRYFLEAPEIGKELTVEIERGKTLVVVLTAIGAIDESGHREVFFELNGQPRRVRVRDRSVEAAVAEREKANPENPGAVGAPMPGTVIELKVAEGDSVTMGAPLVVLSAMKMEMVVAAPVSGEVKRIAVGEGDVLAAGDLLVEIAA
jgi:pyruvate carboxylase